ncbi:MAG: AEC family transporter [Oscillospiraceae bacterium]|nr:AEC family transporter [Oscillospiraceae bacterium]
MQTVISVIQTALPVFLALALGMLCRRIGFLTREGVDTLKKVVVNLTLPAVLLSAFATAEYSLSTIAMPVVMFLLCCVALALGFLVVRLFRIQSRLAPFLASGFEAGMLGYALFVLLFPDKSVSGFAMLDIGHTLFVFTLYKILLSGKTDWKAIGKDLITTPILWAVFFGVIIGATGLYKAMGTWGVSGVFDGITDFISAPTGMVILLTVGYDLVPKEIPWKKTAGLMAMRLGVLALVYGLLVVINRNLLGGMIFEGAALLMMILPPPYVIPVFADEPAERVQISSALSALTLLTIILFAILTVVFSL